MPVKHFLVSTHVGESPKETISAIRQAGELILVNGDKKRFETNKEIFGEEDSLKHVQGRIIVKMDLQSKSSHTFDFGLTIRRERQYNNFNNREVQPVNAIVIDAEYIPKGSEILVHFNAIHDVNRVFNYKDNNSDIKYYSVKEEECFAYFNEGEWLPLKNFDFALRVFKPYEGLMMGVEPTKMKDVLYVTTGELKGRAVMTLPASDYEIVFQGHNGREDNLIRFRPFGDGKEREEEAIAILEDITEKINNDQYFIGLTTTNARRKSELFRKD